MRLFMEQVQTIVWKDLVAEFREAHHLFSVVLFGLLLFLLFSFALSVDPELMRKMAPGLFWLALIFSSLLALEHSFRRESEDGQWSGLVLLGIDSRALYLGKLLGNLAVMLLCQVLLLPAMAALFDLSLSWSLGGVLLLGSFGIATLGTLYAGLTNTLREGQVLLPLLLFPMLVPVLLASVKLTELLLAHDVFGQTIAWFKLLIVFDMVFLLGCLLLVGVLYED